MDREVSWGRSMVTAFRTFIQQSLFRKFNRLLWYLRLKSDVFTLQHFFNCFTMFDQAHLLKYNLIFEELYWATSLLTMWNIVDTTTYLTSVITYNWAFKCCFQLFLFLYLLLLVFSPLQILEESIKNRNMWHCFVWSRGVL